VCGVLIGCNRGRYRPLQFPKQDVVTSGHNIRSALLSTLFALALFAISSCGAAAQSTAESLTETKILPEADVHVQFPSNLRILAFAGLEQGLGFPYQQWYAAAALGYQFRPILRPHLRNLDPDKEYYLVFGGGYEYLRTIQSGKMTREDRVTIEITPGFRLPANFLMRDRNWTELRVANGKYSMTYRNRLTVERDFVVRGFRFTPYGTAEIFYDGAKHSWNEKWYTAGVQWPYQRLFMLDTYYRREDCPTCVPANWNGAGITLHFFFGSPK